MIHTYMIDFSMAPKPSTRKRPPQNRSVISIPDHEQPLSHWRSLKKEVLQLACNTLHLVDTGTIPMLARRIFDYHRNNQVNDPAPVNISVNVPTQRIRKLFSSCSTNFTTCHRSNCRARQSSSDFITVGHRN